MIQYMLLIGTKGEGRDPVYQFQVLAFLTCGFRACWAVPKMVEVGRAAALRKTPVLVPVSVSVSDSTSPPERLVSVTVTV
jgi:hypothetical protein